MYRATEATVSVQLKRFQVASFELIHFIDPKMQKCGYQGCRSCSPKQESRKPVLLSSLSTAQLRHWCNGEGFLFVNQCSKHVHCCRKQ